MVARRLLLFLHAASALQITPRAPCCQMLGSKVFPLNEFSRPLTVDSLGKKAVRNEISASAEECEALAKRFDLESLGSLNANVSCTLIDRRKARVRARGTFSAGNVVQIGFGTIPVNEVTFETFFSDEAAVTGGKNSYDSEEEDTYDEPVEEGQIDLGELVAQHLYLHISQPVDGGDDDNEFAPGEVVYDSAPGGGIDV